MPLSLALVSEEAFPELRLLFEDKTFPKNYAEYLKLLERYDQDAVKLELTTIRVRINPKEFAAWLKKNPATPSDLFRYAHHVHRHGRGLHEEPEYAAKPELSPKPAA